MTLDLADIARGRRIVALAARDLSLCVRHTRPHMSTLARALRLVGLAH